MDERGNRLIDIARLSGVSIGTVDRVIHDRGKVSESARNRVIQAVAHLNYKPNLLARSLRLKTDLSVSILIPDESEDEYWNTVKEGINSEKGNWSHYGINVNFISYPLNSANLLDQKFEEFKTLNPGGFILAPVNYLKSLEFLKWAAEKKIPYVLFDSNIPEANPLSFIGQDLLASGRLAAELIQKTKSKSGEIAILHIDEDLGKAAYLQKKESGFMELFVGIGEKLSVYAVKPNQADTKEKIRSIIAQPELAAIFVTTSRATSIVASVLESEQRTNLTFVGYDLLKENVRQLKNGVITFLINQNPRLMARTALSYLLSSLVFHKEIPSEEYYPLDVVTKENVDSYLRFQQHNSQY